jgi:hypothetical protein
MMKKMQWGRSERKGGGEEREKKREKESGRGGVAGKNDLFFWCNFLTHHYLNVRFGGSSRCAQEGALGVEKAFSDHLHDRTSTEMI